MIFFHVVLIGTHERVPIVAVMFNNTGTRAGHRTNTSTNAGPSSRSSGAVMGRSQTVVLVLMLMLLLLLLLEHTAVLRNLDGLHDRPCEQQVSGCFGVTERQRCLAN